jgi:hypothetical protein
MSEKMTIAQALRRIKKLKGHIAEHQSRAQAGVSYVAGKLPAFRFEEEKDAMLSDIEEMVDLEASVAVANANTKIVYDEEEVSLSHAIRQLQETKSFIAFLKGLHLRTETIRDRETEWDDNKMQNVSRVTEVVYTSDLSEQDRDEQVKALQNHFETLNNLVEDANHSTTV